MLIHRETKSITGSDTGWSGGIWIGNTTHKINGLLKQIYVKSNTVTTTFRFRLTDNKNRIIYDSNDSYTGTLRQDVNGIPIKDGIYEMKIYNSSAEEAFEIMLSIEE